MSDRDPIAAETLDRVVPASDEAGDWDAVVRDARPSRARQALALAAPVAVLLAVGALALLWPFGAGHTGILDRARAAVGDGPVWHIVLRGDWGGTNVDLDTGERMPVYGDDEYWYDAGTGIVHQRGLLGSYVQTENLGHPAKLPFEIDALVSKYRDALEHHTARIAEEGTVDGEPVYWIVYSSQMLPDVADDRDHEFSQQVAVSKSTFEPVALRSTRDGEQGPGTLERVVKLETVSEGQGDFTADPHKELNGLGFAERKEPATLETAAAALGARPLWLGHSYNDLPLSDVEKTTTSTGRAPQVELHGQEAQDVRDCLGQAAGKAGRTGPACERMHASGNTGVEIRDGNVYATRGKVVWRTDITGLSLFYGTLDDDPTTYRKDMRPDFRKPYVQVTESMKAGGMLLPGVLGYAPPEGWIFLAASRIGVLKRDGLYVAIQAPSEADALAAARALGPMPG